MTTPRMGSTIARLSVVLALLPAVARAAEGPTTPSPKPRAAPARVKLTPREAQELVNEMSAVVERLRGQKFKTPVAMQIIDGAGARAFFKSKIEPRDEEQMRFTQEVYFRLGLVSKDTDLVTNYLDLAEAGVDGYYEPGSKTFYVLDHVAQDQIRNVMAHELTHALDDQYFDLQAISKLAGGNDDRSTALAALVEGSAMVVMMTYIEEQRMSGKGSVKEARTDEVRRVDRLKKAPAFMQRSLMLPYVLGFSFMLRGHPWNFYRGGMPMSDLNYAFAHPPQATRHIIHPELFWRRPDIKFTQPKLPDLSRVLGEGWTKVTEGSIGELGLAVFTGAPLDFDKAEILLPESWSTRVSAGTIGDMYQHYVNGDRRLTVWVTAWENAAKAQAFAKTLPPATQRRAYFSYGANHLVLMGEFGDASKAETLATTAFQGATYWPHDEGVLKWPPDRGPEFYKE